MTVPFRVKALYEYSSPHDDDLKFAEGQIITVTQEEDDDWYEGEYVDNGGVKQEGIFPRNFVEKFEPVAPPRPTRTRTKREPEAPQHLHEEELSATPPQPPSEKPDLSPEEDVKAEEEPEHVEEILPVDPPAPVPAAVERAPAPILPPVVSKPSETSAAAASVQVPKPKPKPTGPPVAEKPSSFKDRIAAFNNKADERPPAPFKPGGLAGSKDFIKKPFVAPPPSRNAYVPPPRDPLPTKEYRREEDPEIKEREAEAQQQAEKAGLAPAQTTQEDAAEDQPKPTSLKERIALLQKQQLEQAQRHADAAAKKEKPKRPVKKRTPSSAPAEATEKSEDVPDTEVVERRDVDDLEARTSMDEVPPIKALPRRKSSRGPAADVSRDGNEADMSGAGDTTEGQEDEREDSDETPRRASRTPTVPVPAARIERNESEKSDEEDTNQNAEDEEGEEAEDGEEEDEDVDPEVKRKEELRARMAKMSGGMGFHGMFGGPAPPVPAAAPKKKKAKAGPAPVAEGDEEEAPTSRAAPPIPTPMAMHGMNVGTSHRKSEETTRGDTDEPVSATRAVPPPIPSRSVEEQRDENDSEGEGDDAVTPAPVTEPLASPRVVSGPPPPIPGGRPAPPPVPSESRPPPPPPPANVTSQTEGSQSDDELSAGTRDTEHISLPARPVPPPPQPPQSPGLPLRSPPLSPRADDSSATSPSSTLNKRNSRPPPPIPGAAPILPPIQSRPPPPPPPGGLSRQSTAEMHIPPSTKVPQAGEEEGEEVTEYEGDYDTDIASSVPHKDALKAHARESSLEDNSLQSPLRDVPPTLPPPVPTGSAPKAVPPPVPSQPAPEAKRQSMDVPRAAPPPPPPAKEPIPTQVDEEYDTYNYTSPRSVGIPAGSGKTPRIEEEAYFPGPASPSDRRPPPPPAPAGRMAPPRQSMDAQRTSTSNRRSMDLLRPSLESGFIANDIDLAVQSGWWKQANQVPPVLQGRRDIFYECEETTSTNQGVQTIITRNVAVLFQDYSQTIITVQYDPYNTSEAVLDQHHEPPPRSLRQDQMEEFYDRFGRRIAEAAAAKKDTVVGDGTPQTLVMELLRPLKDALWPVGIRSYGALVYSNMANASTQQHDVIRAGDILSFRNGKFQGKHGPMHAKYSAEVGKPDHVAIVAEWDGTKKKVRAWEQGRESKKVKMESFKLDDLRSGEVKIWRVVPRSWVGWNSQP